MRQNKPFLPVGIQPPLEPRESLSRGEAMRQRLRRFYTRFQSVFLIGAGVLITLTSFFMYDSIKPPPQRLTQRDINAAVERALESATPKPSFESQVYETIRPSLVIVQSSVTNADGETENSLGSGVVVADNGTILTALHVVDGDAEVVVVFADGSESEASVVFAQPENDLAVLRPSIIPDDLVPATLGSSAMLRVGDEVVAVGNPFGMTNSLSAGVVSGLGRSFTSQQTGETLRGLIQFDAAVNPGNSGGPLLNRDGEVVGIVTALLNPVEQDFFIGIGFAVPIESAGGGVGVPPV